MTSVYDTNIDSVPADVLENHLLSYLPICSLVACALVGKVLRKPVQRAISTKLRHLGNSAGQLCPFPKLEILLSVFEHGNASLLVWFAKQLGYPTVAIVLCSDKQQQQEKKSIGKVLLSSLRPSTDVSVATSINDGKDVATIADAKLCTYSDVLLLKPWIKRKVPLLADESVESIAADTVQACLQLAAYHDRLDIFEYIWQQYPDEFLRKASYVTKAAAYAGHLRILQWAHEKQMLHTPQKPTHLIRLRSPSATVEEEEEEDEDEDLFQFRVPFDSVEDITRRALIGGHLHIVSWLYGFVERLLRPEMCIQLVRIASARSHTHILDWALERGLDGYMDERMWSSAASLGQQRVLEWAYEKGFQFNAGILAHQAAINGQFTMARWLVEKHRGLWLSTHKDTAACTAAVHAGDLDALKWLHGIGCKWDYQTILHAIEDDRVDMLGWMREQNLEGWDDYLVCKHASYKASLSTIRWLIQHGGLVWTQQTTLDALQYRDVGDPKDVEVLCWIREHDAQLSHIVQDAVEDNKQYVYVSNGDNFHSIKRKAEIERKQQRLKTELCAHEFFIWCQARRRFGELSS